MMNQRDLQFLEAKIPAPLYDWPGSRASRRGKRRILGDNREVHFYHLMTRSNDIQWDEVEKEALRKLLIRSAKFAKIDLLTYCVMGNHWHALVRVRPLKTIREPFRSPNGEEYLFSHLESFYSKAYLKGLRAHLDKLRQQGCEDEAKEILESFINRIGDLAWFVKSVKERFSKWYNKRHERAGTHWRERYKSVLVENGKALRTMAAYIDLNPVRAGLVDDPKDYRWSGYAEAVAGNKRFQLGLSLVFEKERNSWNQGSVASAYRQFLYMEGRERLVENHKGQQRLEKPGISLKNYDRELRHRDGHLSPAKVLRCQINFFTKGVAIGSKTFVDQIFEQNRDQFGPNRKSGGQPIRGEAWGKLHTLRRPGSPSKP